jgi:hypothetical protein
MVIESGADITTKFINCRCQCPIPLLFLPPLSEQNYIRFQTSAFFSDSFTLRSKRSLRFAHLKIAKGQHIGLPAFRY